uniref:Lactamase_B domain-containing protein n=1 Tax=Meloidogyne hapla TaxID=6305 RepID=A0A1I8B341_MELHA
MDSLKSLNKIKNPIILQDLTFKITQIIIGNVQFDLHPKKENLSFCLNNFDFVGAKCSVTLIEKIGENFKMLVDCASPYEKEQLFEGDIFEFENDWLGEEMWKSSSLLPDRQSLARWLCWNKADFIIPGHGPGFLTLKKEPPTQRPIFGKIFFESDKISISKKSNNKNLFKIKELLTFTTFIQEKHLLIYIYLIKSINLNILVNTGGINQRKELIKALNSEGLSPSLINFVIISYPGRDFCGNLSDFPTSTIFMCTDIAVPGPFYATFDHHFTFLDENEQISVWRDLRTDSSDKCLLSILVEREKKEGYFDFIGLKIDEYLIARFGLNERDIKLNKIFCEIQASTYTY